MQKKKEPTLKKRSPGPDGQVKQHPTVTAAQPPSPQQCPEALSASHTQHLSFPPPASQAGKLKFHHLLKNSLVLQQETARPLQEGSQDGLMYPLSPGPLCVKHKFSFPHADGDTKARQRLLLHCSQQVDEPMSHHGTKARTPSAGAHTSPHSPAFKRHFEHASQTQILNYCFKLWGLYFS